MEYKIDGLTKKQVTLLDIMWTLDDEDSLQNFIRSLPQRDRYQAESLSIILVHEMLEEFLDGVTRFPEVQKILERVR
jgi:hypothetical protein